jgi:hypothetical protein
VINLLVIVLTLTEAEVDRPGPGALLGDPVTTKSPVEFRSPSPHFSDEENQGGRETLSSQALAAHQC